MGDPSRDEDFPAMGPPLANRKPRNGGKYQFPSVPYNGLYANEVAGGADMNQTWKQWQGQFVNQKFPLQKYLGSSDHSIVFLTERGAREPQKAAIKLVADDPEYAAAKLAVWAQASTLGHPNLLRIFEAGRCQIGNVALLYVVMEYAEENLSEILGLRHLSPAEAQQMLPPVLSALTYLHGKGFVHGHLKPSNIMAVADQVKLSGDSLRIAGELSATADCRRGTNLYDAPEIARGPVTPAADVWSLGVTLKEVSPMGSSKAGGGEKGASNAPEPLWQEGISDSFLDIVSHCLEQDPRQRWTTAEIAARLEPSAIPYPNQPLEPGAEDSEPPLHPRPAKALARWLVASIAIAGLVLMIFLGLRMRRSQPSQSQVGQSVGQSTGQPPVPVASEPAQVQPEPKPTPAIVPPKKSTVAEGSGPLNPAGTRVTEMAPAGVRQQVLPDVPLSARNTIEGHVRVGVKVDVDASGSVVGATLESPGPSQYFARLALEAARRWKFFPAQMNGDKVPSKWILRFAFGRLGTDVHPTQVAP